MADKLHTMQLLLRKLARIPGLGFLSSMDDALQQIDDTKEAAEHAALEGQRHVRDVQLLSKELVSEDED